jgi:Cu2+-exporting ATPase
MNALRLNLWKPKKINYILDQSKEMCANQEITRKENKTMTVTIKVEGMMCPHCEARVKKACEAVEGVTLAAPSHERGEVVIECVSDVAEACKKAITDAGYDVIG